MLRAAQKLISTRHGFNCVMRILPSMHGLLLTDIFWHWSGVNVILGANRTLPVPSTLYKISESVKIGWDTGVYCQYVDILWITKSNFMSVRNIFSWRKHLYLAGICMCREKCRSWPLGWSLIMRCNSQCAMSCGHTDQTTLQSTSNIILWYRI